MRVRMSLELEMSVLEGLLEPQLPKRSGQIEKCGVGPVTASMKDRWKMCSISPKTWRSGICVLAGLPAKRIELMSVPVSPDLQDESLSISDWQRRALSLMWLKRVLDPR